MQLLWQWQVQKEFSRLLDEKVEVDEGYVTLVNAKEENGKLTESEKRTGRWAWKHTHQADGSVDYIELKGNVVSDIMMTKSSFMM